MTWKLINEVTYSKCRSKDDIINLKTNDHDVNVKNDLITASNMFNNFFINIAKNSLIKPKTTEISQEHKISSFNEVYLKKIESSDILDIINKFNDDTAVGLDKVSVKILKLISNLIVNPLVYLYNLNIEQGIFLINLK